MMPSFPFLSQWKIKMESTFLFEKINKKIVKVFKNMYAVSK